MDMVKEQRAWGHVTGTDHKINKMGLKRGHLQHLYISKEMPARYHDGEILQSPSREPTCWGASLKCLYTNACSMGNKHDEIQICVQLQGYKLAGIAETWWDGSHDSSVRMKGYREG